MPRNCVCSSTDAILCCAAVSAVGSATGDAERPPARNPRAHWPRACDWPRSALPDVQHPAGPAQVHLSSAPHVRLKGTPDWPTAGQRDLQLQMARAAWARNQAGARQPHLRPSACTAPLCLAGCSSQDTLARALHPANSPMGCLCRLKVPDAEGSFADSPAGPHIYAGLPAQHPSAWLAAQRSTGAAAAAAGHKAPSSASSSPMAGQKQQPASNSRADSSGRPKPALRQGQRQPAQPQVSLWSLRLSLEPLLRADKLAQLYATTLRCMLSCPLPVLKPDL